MSDVDDQLVARCRAGDLQALEALYRRYAERVWSRIYQHGDYVELDSPDMRITPLPGSHQGLPRRKG